MATVQLTDDGVEIKFVRGTKTKYLPKEGMTVSVFDTGIFLNTEEGSENKIYLSEVTVPVVATVEALRAAIDAMLAIIPAAGLPADASTETKQDANIAKLELMRIILASLDTKDYATQTTLALIDTSLNSIKAEDFATQTTLALIDTSLNSIKAEDFATQTTLATLATEAKLEAVRVLLASLDTKDFATQTTLATLATEAKLETVRVLLESLDGKDYATQATLALIDTSLNSIKAEDFATQATLAAVLTELQLKADLTETQPVSIASVLAPITETLAQAGGVTATMLYLTDFAPYITGQVVMDSSTLDANDSTVQLQDSIDGVIFKDVPDGLFTLDTTVGGGIYTFELRVLTGKKYQLIYTKGTVTLGSLATTFYAKANV